MPSGSRKRVSGAVDDFIDGGQFPPKRAKMEKSKRDTEAAHQSIGSAQNWRLDASGDKFWELSKMRRVTVSSFRGKTFINIREYYERDGQELPGKKGISLPIDQFSSLVTLLPDIETALRESGQFISRPDYGGDDGQADEVPRDGTEPSMGADVVYSSRKNIDATSDEDESEE
ncbi:transcriptional coactivator p15/PC4 family protein [Aspergillus clavatus NRRL 1]|uniref:RNA polymerase II transcriptional coactivator, putative n=1 Tax=Aspergillus clavatus (strain ATCC 1007 / CBS 513.65 / DSM 816 / NCTC 3887 / NRRL 1 / QM 1276 / 107) TaxID=344612 RepID=A1CSH6_ASPCL|nr:RNA polymerase II transcriptional coactivator, putative [Aspergillus clavatus NRRL 1]EAW06263.1 RNA polymerase II transcriptional coactivator, putative [Aspergillus clavatus NRRL 1]